MEELETALIAQALRLGWYEKYRYGSVWWQDAYDKLIDAVEAFEQKYPAYSTELRENSNDFTPEEDE